jgi:hypothetical protein
MIDAIGIFLSHHRYIVKVIEALIASIPVVAVTIIIWQINVSGKRKRDILTLVSQLSKYLYKYHVIFNEIEIQEIRFTAALKNNKKSLAKRIRAVINKSNRLKLDLLTEIMYISNRLIVIMNNRQENEFVTKLQAFDALKTRRFEDVFKDVLPENADEAAKTIETQIEKDLTTIGIGKITSDIMIFLNKEFNNKKGNPFKNYINRYRKRTN